MYESLKKKKFKKKNATNTLKMRTPVQANALRYQAPVNLKPRHSEVTTY